MAIESTRLGNLVGNFTRTINTDATNNSRSVSLTNGSVTREKTINPLLDGAVRTVSFTGPKASRESTITTDGQGGATRTSSLTTDKFSRNVSTSVDAEGNKTRSVTMTTADGKEISRERTKTVNADGSTTLTGSITGLSGVRTYVADVTSESISGEFTVTRDNSTKTVSFDRKKSLEPEPPAPPVVTDPEPVDLFGTMPVLYGAIDQTA